MTSRSRTTLLLAVLALAAAAAAYLLARGPGEKAPRGDVTFAVPAPPPGFASTQEAREPEQGAPGVAPSDGWSRTSRAEVNAAGLARAASRREKEREAECPPGKGGEGEAADGCDPERAAGSVEIDWNGRRASP